MAITYVKNLETAADFDSLFRKSSKDASLMGMKTF